MIYMQKEEYTSLLMSRLPGDMASSLDRAALERSPVVDAVFVSWTLCDRMAQLEMAARDFGIGCFEE